MIGSFEEITDYVLDKGYQEVVLIKGRQEAEVTHKRFQGFQKSLEKHHLLIQQSEICLCDFREEEAFKNARAYIEKYGKSRARAFICMSDIMALVYVELFMNVDMRYRKIFQLQVLMDCIR